MSRENQLVDYGDILYNLNKYQDIFPELDLNKINKKYLILIASSLKIAAAEKITIRKIKDKDKDITEYFKSINVLYKSIKWEDIVLDIGDNDTFQFEFKNFINNYIYEEFTKMDNELLKNPAFPGTLQKIFNYVSKTRDYLNHPSFKTCGMGESMNFYGFSIEHKHFSLWFGYALPFWEIVNSPVVLRIRSEWIKDKNKSPIIHSIIEELGFIKDKESEYLLKIEIDHYDYWHEDIMKIFESFDKSFEK